MTDISTFSPFDIALKRTVGAITGNADSSLLDDNLAYRNNIWKPDPRNKPQCMAYDLAVSGEVMEIGYGGQAGGGKTDLAIGLGSVFDKTLILRREFPQLEGIIDRGNSVYPTTFVGGIKKRWEFDGHIITLGSVQRDHDWKKYQGRANSLIEFDEAAEFSETPVRNITGWSRSSNPDQRTLVLYLFNPPTTPDGEWIVKYFAPWIDPQYTGAPAKPGEIRWFAHLPGQNSEVIEVEDGEPFESSGEMVYPISRTFIPASRHDNPFLGQEYERRLQALPEPLRTLVMKGDFTLGTQDDEWQAIPTNWVLEAQARWEAMRKPDVELRAVGVDVAHGGRDKTSIAKLYGTWFAPIISYPGSETPKGKDVADYVEKNMESIAPIGVDAAGWGASAAERLEDNPNLTIHLINAGEGSDGTDKSGKYSFANCRAEMVWKLREALDPESGEDIALPPSRDLRVDLCAARYSTKGGKIRIEDKLEIKSRIKRSPDEGESVIHCWHVLVMELKRKRRSLKPRPNPFYGGQ
jgi:hypothetical protein